MTDPDTQLNAGKRLFATAAGRAYKDGQASSGKEGAGPIDPRHKSIGIEDTIQEHEGERLNPGSEEGGTGAPANRPHDPSNSA